MGGKISLLGVGKRAKEGRKATSLLSLSPSCSPNAKLASSIPRNIARSCCIRLSPVRRPPTGREPLGRQGTELRKTRGEIVKFRDRTQNTQ